MKFSVTLIVVLLFLTVAFFYVHLMPEPEDVQVEEMPAVMKVLPLEDGDEVTSIEIRYADRGDAIRLGRHEDGWYLEDPVVDKAEELVSEGLMKALTLSAKARRLKRERGWDEYGLENPQLRIGVETRKNPVKRWLTFGDSSPVGNRVFARWEGEDEYFLVNPELLRVFDRSAYSLREKKVFRSALRSLDKIRLETLSGEFEFIRKGEQWLWTEPITILGEPVDRESLDRIQTALRNLYIRDFLDERDIRDWEAGLSVVMARVQLWSGESVEQLDVGREKPERAAFYGRRAGDESMFLLAADKIRQLFEVIETLAVRAGSGSAV